MLKKQYADTYKGEYTYDLVVTNGQKTRISTFIPNKIKYRNNSYIGVCYAGPTDLPLHRLDLPYPSFSHEEWSDFTVHNRTYTYNNRENIIPFKPLLSRPSSMIYVASFYKFETLIMFGMEGMTEKQFINLDTVISTYDDTDYIMVTDSGQHVVPDFIKYNTNFYQVSWKRLKSLLQ